VITTGNESIEKRLCHDTKGSCHASCHVYERLFQHSENPFPTEREKHTKPVSSVSLFSDFFPEEKEKEVSRGMTPMTRNLGATP
jgi:hypothetical protein